MKIDTTTPLRSVRPVGVGASQEGAPTEEMTDPRATSAKQRDRVSLEGPRDRAVVESARQSDREARAERIKRLTQQVQDGTYDPDPTAIAARMMESEQWLKDLDTDMEALAAERQTP